MKPEGLGRLGIFSGELAPFPADVQRRVVAELEALGYGAIWYGEAFARETFVQGAIEDPAVVADAIAGCDAVVNFAAETHVDRSILDPEAFIRTDVMGTHVLLEAVRRHTIPRYLQVSTDEVYGDVDEGASTDSPMGHVPAQSRRA